MKLITKSVFWMALSLVCTNAHASSIHIEEEKNYTLDTLSEKICKESNPLHALYKIWTTAVCPHDMPEESEESPLASLDKGQCYKGNYVRYFAQLCHQIGFEVRPVNMYGKEVYEFNYQGKWELLDPLAQQWYLGLDNQMVAASDDLMDDPFLVLRSKHNRSAKEYDLQKSWEELARFEIISNPLLPVAIQQQETNLVVQPRDSETIASCVEVLNTPSVFDFCTPNFALDVKEGVEMIRWQISNEDNFSFVSSSLDQTEPAAGSVAISPLAETFFNDSETYYFRVKGCLNGEWSQWSKPVAFEVKKPERVIEIEFSKLDTDQFELSWIEDKAGEREYLIFGSNSLDFVPSVYTSSQVNVIVNGETLDEKQVDNLVAIVKEPRCVVDGSLAYYRVIARENGQLSVPSNIIYAYDEEYTPSRNVLQLVDLDSNHVIAKRVQIPTTYTAYETCDMLPHVLPSAWENHRFDLNGLVLSKLETNPLREWVKSPHVTPDVWERVKPYLLPENSPVKPKLDRIFTKTRVTLTSETFKKAGFKRNRIGRFSRIMASAHPDLQGYFVKVFADTELYIPCDWAKWIHRIEGAKSLQRFINKRKYGHTFKVPKKWIYPLPADPSPPRSDKYLRKNFILIAEDMQIYDFEKNNKYYKKKMTKEILDLIYIALQEEGLWDSVYSFNIPFCKNDKGKLAFIDTEYHHKWPVPFSKFTKWFSKDMGKYWEKLIRDGGPEEYRKEKLKKR